MKNKNSLKSALLLEFWQKETRNYDISLLTAFFEKSEEEKERDCRLEFKLEKIHSNSVRKLCNNSELLIFNFYSSILTIVLNKYLDINDFCLISPCAQFEELNKDGEVFLYKSFAKEDESFKEIFSKNKEFMFRSLEFSCSYSELEKNCETLKNIEEIGLVLNDKKCSDLKPKLLFRIVDDLPLPLIVIEFNSKDVSSRYIELFARNFISLLEKIFQNMYEPLNTIEYLSKYELNLLKEFNASKHYFSVENDILSLIEKYGLLFPEKTAIVHNKRSVNYFQLLEISKSYAKELLSQRLNKEDKVVVMIERSIEFTTSILATWMAGGAYIPIDTEYPSERIKLILEETKATHVFVSKNVLSKVRSLVDGTSVKYINVIEEGLLVEEKVGDLSNSVTKNRKLGNAAVEEGVSGMSKLDLDSLAYVIFTSGSTGTPKGVMIEHRGMVNHIGSKIIEMKMDEQSIVAQNAPQTFDISIWQLFSGLACGGTTVIYDKEVILDPLEFLRRISIDQVSVWELVPSYFIECLNVLEDSAEYLDLSNLKILILNAETLMPSMVERWFNLYPNIPIVNTYGATEVSDDISHYIMHSVPSTTTIPVMKGPIQNIEVHIVNHKMSLVPINVKGEILLSGIGVGRGYINDQVKTASSFLQGPLPGITGEKRTYRTGDIGRYLIDGTMEFLGRKDTQVKIRGNRIELGEIEHVLMQIKGIKNCTILANLEQQYLVAYYLSDDMISKDYIIECIKDILPEYMMPNYYVKLERFPLTENGKINKKELPDPLNLFENGNTEYLEPRTIIEKHLAEVYMEVLKKSNVGIRDDFFELGGDSIKAIQIGSLIKQRGYMLKIQDILKYPVIMDLSGCVKQIARNSSQGEMKGVVPLGPIQIAFFERNTIDVNHYNQSILLDSKIRLTEEGVTTAFDQIISHHDSLRMVYKRDVNGWMQECKVNEHSSYFEVIELKESADLTFHCDRIQSSLDLEKGPLYKVVLFREKTQDKLFLVSHHLVIDGVSWRILLEDFVHLYQQYLDKLELNLPLKTDSFKYWQDSMIEYALTDELKKEEVYWNNIENGSIEPLRLDNSTVDNFIKDSGIRSVFLNEQFTNQLVTKCYKAYNTEVNDILITAFSLALDQVFHLEKILIRLEGHGREHIGTDVDVTRTVGWFTTEYPVVLNMKFRKNVIRQLIEIKETLHRVPNKGIGYGILRYVSKKNYKLEPEIVFNYLGDFAADFNAKTKNSLFEFSNDLSGSAISKKAIRDCVFDVSGMIVNGRLNLTINYNSKQFASSTIEKLINAYQNNLENLIASLSSEKEEMRTPVDLTYKGLTMEQLDELNNTLKYSY